MYMTVSKPVVVSNAKISQKWYEDGNYKINYDHCLPEEEMC